MIGRDRPDIWLLLTIALVFAIGIATIYSASTAIAERGIFQRQLVWSLLGLGAFLLGTLVSFRRLEEISPAIYVLVCLMLLITLFLGRGPAGRWLIAGPVHIQASEVAKVGLVLVTAWWLSSLKVRPRKFGELLVFLTVLPVVLLTAVQPDLGTAVSMLLIVLAMFVWAGYGLGWIVLMVSPVLAALSSMHVHYWLGFMAVLSVILYRRKYSLPLWILIIGGNSLVAAITPTVWNMLEPYQQSRLVTFMNPASDPHGSGWNIIQSEVAVGSGGLAGQGYMQGSQKELAFLPARHTDFVFSVWAEETGFIGCMVLLSAFFVLFWRIVRVAGKSVNPYNSLVTAGIAAYFVIHVFVNVGMTLGIMPVTGLPLPLVSYGGSQLLSVFFLLGLVTNAGMYWREV